MTGTHRMRRTQRAFSLIELLVAMAIGLVLTLLVANLFIGSRNTNNTTDEVSRLQENMRYAYQLLTRSIHHAGYRSDPSADPTLIFTGPTVALTGTNGGGTSPDTFTIAFQGSGSGAGLADASVVDCLGLPFDQNVTVVNRFYIRAGASGSQALWCDSTIAGVLVSGEVVPDVDNMQILYGEDTDIVEPRDWIPNRFVPITSVTNVDNIRAVRIALLFSTSSNNPSARTDFDTSGTIDLNGVAVPVPRDKQIRRVAVWNINLRNRSPY